MRSWISSTGLTLALCTIVFAHYATATEEIVISVEPRDVGPGEEWKYHAAILQEMGFATDTETLLGLMAGDPNLVVRGLAASVLGRRGELEAIEDLKIALETETVEGVRGDIAVALVRLGEPVGLEVLRGLLRSARKGSDRVEWASRLAQFGDFSGFSAVVEAARSDKENDRAAAANAAAWFVRPGGNSESVDLLLALSLDPSVWVRSAAIRGFSSAVSRGASPEPFLRAVNRLAEEDEAKDVRDVAKRVAISIQSIILKEGRGG